MRVLILGGTGAVGRWVGSFAADAGHEVVVASRDGARASSTAATIPGASAVTIDLDDSGARIPGGIDVVVDCTGTDRLAISELVAEAGADLLDISATSRHVMQLAESGDLFRTAKRRCVFGAGLAPGLSTMLALAVHDPSDPAPIQIHGVLDTRDEHGEASAAFTLDKIGTSFVDPSTGRPVRNFTGLRWPRLPAGFGRRVVARADFPDQYLLTAELAVPVTTTYGFTQPPITLLFCAAARTPGGRSALGKLASLVPRPTGTGHWIIAAVAAARIAWATGDGQARSTALMAALALERLRDDALQPGVHLAAHVTDLDHIAPKLSRHGIAMAVDTPVRE